MKEMVDYKEIYLPNHRYIELYAEMAEAILQNFHRGKIQIEEERENGDIGFTEEAQDLYDYYCGLVEEVLERCYIFDGFEKEIY